MDDWRLVLAQLSTERIGHCLLCVGEAVQPDRRWDALLGLPDAYHVKRCTLCDLRWLSPRPDADGYAQLYTARHYFHGGGAAPADYAGLADERVAHFRRRLIKAAKIMAAARPLSILDYGAATGEFVEIAKDLGHVGVGVEFSADARADAQAKHGLRLLSPAEASELSATFDIVHMNHVLEHMPDPLLHLRWCLQRVRPGGLLIIEVPQQFDNDLDRLKRFFGRGGRQPEFNAYSLHHTYFFNCSNLTSMVVAAGFEPVTVRTYVPGQRASDSLRTRALRALLWVIDKVHRGGDIIELWARKP